MAFDTAQDGAATIIRHLENFAAMLAPPFTDLLTAGFRIVLERQAEDVGFPTPKAQAHQSPYEQIKDAKDEEDVDPIGDESEESVPKSEGDSSPTSGTSGTPTSDDTTDSDDTLPSTSATGDSSSGAPGEETLTFWPHSESSSSASSSSTSSSSSSSTSEAPPCEEPCGDEGDLFCVYECCTRHDIYIEFTTTGLGNPWDGCSPHNATNCMRLGGCDWMQNRTCTSDDGSYQVRTTAVDGGHIYTNIDVDGKCYYFVEFMLEFWVNMGGGMWYHYNHDETFLFRSEELTDCMCPVDMLSWTLRSHSPNTSDKTLIDSIDIVVTCGPGGA